MSDPTLVDDFIEGFDNPRTRDSYHQAMKLWQRWCDLNDLELLKVERRDIDRWRRHLETEGSGRGPNARSTVAGRLHVLASFYKWAVIEDLILANPMLHVRRPKVPEVGAGTSLKRQEFHRLLEVAEHAGVMEHALICLLGMSGLRVSEALGVLVSDLGRDGYHDTVLVHRKGGKDQYLALNRRTTRAIVEAVGDRTSGPVLLNSRTGGPLNYPAARRKTIRLAKAAGIDRQLTPHSLRRTYVTLSRDAGANSRDLAVSCGHADERMITKYDRNRESHDRNPTHLLEHWVAGAA